MKQEQPSASDNHFELPTTRPTEGRNGEMKPKNPMPDNYTKWWERCRFMEMNPEDKHCVLVLDKVDIPTGARVDKASTGSGTLQAKGQSNLFAEIIFTFCNLEGGREKKQNWAQDLISKPENYLTSKDRDFLAGNIEWDYKRLLKALPAGSLSDDERTIFNVTNDRLKVLLSAAKMELSRPNTTQNVPNNAQNVPEWTSDDIPF